MFNIAGNLSPPLTVSELPFSPRLPRLCSGPNTLSRYVLEGKNRKAKGRERQQLCLAYKARQGFSPFQFADMKYLSGQSSWTADFQGLPLRSTPSPASGDALGCVRCALPCWVTSLTAPLPPPHPQPEPARPFCTQKHKRVGGAGTERCLN